MLDHAKIGIPGQRKGVIRTPALLLDEIDAHFASKADHTKEFLANVRFLERRLKVSQPDQFADYAKRKQTGVGC